MTPVRGAALLADRRFARHVLVSVRGGSSRWHHRRADVLLDRTDRADVLLSGAVEVPRWR